MKPFNTQDPELASRFFRFLKALPAVPRKSLSDTTEIVGNCDICGAVIKHPASTVQHFCSGRFCRRSRSKRGRRINNRIMRLRRT